MCCYDSECLLRGSVLDACTCLVYGEDEDLGDVNVGWSCGGPDNLLCDVFANKRLQALVDVLRGAFVTAIPDDGELGFDHAGIDLGDADLGVDELTEEGTGEGANSVLGCGVDAASGVGFPTSDRTEVNNVAVVLCLELLDEQLGQMNQTKYVGFEHALNIVGCDVSDVLDTEDESSVVNQNVDVSELGGNLVKEALDLATIGDVEGDRGELASLL